MTEAQTIKEDENGFFVAPSGLPAHYAEEFNEMSRKHRLSFHQAVGLLTVFRLHYFSDRTYQELCAAESLTVRTHDGGLEAHPLLDAFVELVADMRRWCGILGLFSFEDAEDN